MKLTLSKLNGSCLMYLVTKTMKTYILKKKKNQNLSFNINSELLKT